MNEALDDTRDISDALAAPGMCANLPGVNVAYVDAFSVGADDITDEEVCNTSSWLGRSRNYFGFLSLPGSSSANSRISIRRSENFPSTKKIFVRKRPRRSLRQKKTL